MIFKKLKEFFTPEPDYLRETAELSLKSIVKLMIEKKLISEKDGNIPLEWLKNERHAERVSAFAYGYILGARSIMKPNE